MVFSSLPIYQFDPPNWQQLQQMNQQPGGGTNNQNPNHHFPPPLPPQPPPVAPPPSQVPGAGHSSSQPRPNSMVERARLAKIPLPEAALKCPRCESTNTKFCYFNNYSLTQPRHFCKTCRRYWTRGGALRNVPVGGGCRRNKRSKSNGGSGTRSKSTVVVAADHQQASNSSTPTLSSHPSYLNPSNKFLNIGQIPALTSNLPIFPPLQSFGEYSPSNIGLDFGGIQLHNTSGMSSSAGGLLDQWRSSLQQVQQFPFLINTAGLEQSSSVLYPLMDGNEGVNQEREADFENQLRSKPLMDMAVAGDTQPESVKVEESDQDGVNNLSRNFLGNININSANDQYSSWGGSSNSWNTDLPGFASSNPTSHLL